MDASGKHVGLEAGVETLSGTRSSSFPTVARLLLWDGMLSPLPSPPKLYCTSGRFLVAMLFEVTAVFHVRRKGLFYTPVKEFSTT